MSWRTLRMDDLKASVPYSFVGGPFGSNLTTRDYMDDGIPVIRGNNLSADTAFVDADFVFVSDTKADSLRPNTAFPGDLIFTQRGTLGQVGIIPTDACFQRYIISQSQMKLTVDREIADPRFVYYYFRLPDTVQSVINNAATSGVPHINLGTLKDFKISLPEVDVQNRIASILSAYDDAIENNRRRMALLEKAARLLYEEWFVRLRFPGHEHTPVKGGVPEGWERGQLDEVVFLQRGFDITKDQQQAGPFPVVSSSGINSFHSEFKAKGPGIVIGRKGSLGTVHWVEDDYWPHDTTLWVKEFRRGSVLYSLHLLKKLDLAGFDTGAAVPTLNRNHVHCLPIIHPPERLVVEFEMIANNFFSQIVNLKEQNQKLRTARDLLLPRLMSGEIEVSN